MYSIPKRNLRISKPPKLTVAKATPTIIDEDGIIVGDEVIKSKEYGIIRA